MDIVLNINYYNCINIQKNILKNKECVQHLFLRIVHVILYMYMNISQRVKSNKISNERNDKDYNTNIF